MQYNRVQWKGGTGKVVSHLALNRNILSFTKGDFGTNPFLLNVNLNQYSYFSSTFWILYRF